MKKELLRRDLRDGKETIEYQLQAGEMMDGQVLKACKDRRLTGILPMGAAYEEGHNYIYAYPEKRKMLAECLQDVVTRKLILCTFESIVNTLINLEEKGINLAYVPLDTQYIYVEEDMEKARLICMPGKNAVMEEGEVQDFFRTILANAIYLNSEDGDYVAKILSALNKEFDLKSFLRQIHGLMLDAGIEIKEEVLPETEEPVSSEAPMEESIQEGVLPAEPMQVEMPLVEPVPVEPMPVEMPLVEPVIAEPVQVEMSVVESVIAEPVQVVEPVPVEPVQVEMPVVEPVIAEPVQVEMPVVEPVIAEPVQPEIPAAGATAVKAQGNTSLLPEDDIEFEPMPEEMNAKIQRMNDSSLTGQNPPVSPTSSAYPSTPPMSQHQGTVPTSPMPQIMPQDASLQSGQRKPNPHLIRLKTGENIPLPEGRFLIGKSQEGGNYIIADNAAISRIHCSIIKKNGAYYVRDERSTNGTFVNGEQVLPDTERLLLNNSKLTLGDEEFLYSLW